MQNDNCDYIVITKTDVKYFKTEAEYLNFIDKNQDFI